MSWNARALGRLASLRLTVGLLLWLAFLCVLGTVVPQHVQPSANDEPLPMRLVRLLSLRDVFVSLWFLVPTVVLALNILACMYARRKALAGLSKDRAFSGAGMEEVAVPSENDCAHLLDKLASVMKDAGMSVSRPEESGKVMVGVKGRIRAFAPLMVHTSILLILLGVALGFTGFKGSLEIPIGQASDKVVLADGSILRLPFEVRCNDFTVELYDNGMPKEYRSDVSFVKNGRTASRASILVNHPAGFENVLFSQSGYNNILHADIVVETPSGISRIDAVEGTHVEMKDTGYRLHVVRVFEDIMHMGPAAQLLVEMTGSEEEVWVFAQFERIKAMHPGILDKMPRFDPSRIRPFKFSLNGVRSGYNTILGINRDPGIVFVGLGSVFFLAGICIAFMVVHEKIRVSVEEGGRGGLLIKVVQRCNNRPVRAHGPVMEYLESLKGDRP